MFFGVWKRAATVGLALAMPLFAQQPEPIVGGNPALPLVHVENGRIRLRRRRRIMSCWCRWTDFAGTTRSMMVRRICWRWAREVYGHRRG